MKNKIKSCVVINAKGKNLYKFINSIHNDNYYCFRQYCHNDIFTAQIYRSDLKRIIALAEEYGIELNHYETDSLFSRIGRYRRRIGIILGIVLSVCSYIYFSGIIVTIEIVGNKSVSDDSVLSAMREIGISQGTHIKDINFIQAENQLMVMVKGVSWVGMQNSGNHLVVQITEYTEKPKMTSERIPCNIVSSHNAEITSTTVYDGMLMKIVGDYVREGDILINGVTSDNTGHTTFHHAMGKIIGIYDVEETFTEPLTCVRTVTTGNVVRQNTLKLFNFRIPLYFGSTPYTEYSSEKTEKNIKIFGRYLPIGITAETLAETETSEITCTADEAEQKIIDKIYLFEKNFIDSETEIVSRNITKSIGNTEIKYTVNYKIKGDICREKEIFIKTESDQQDNDHSP